MPDLDDLPPILTTGEVAALLHMNVQTVQAWARDGRFPGCRLVARKYLIPAADIRALFPAAHPVTLAPRKRHNR